MDRYPSHDTAYWLQRFLPWLGLLSLALALTRGADMIGFDPDDLQG